MQGDRSTRKSIQGGRNSTSKDMAEKVTCCLESYELSCLFQALPGEGWLFSGKTLGQKDEDWRCPSCLKSTKVSVGWNQIHTALCCCYWTRLLKVAWEPTPPPSILLSSSLPSVIRVVFLSTKSFWNWLLPVRGRICLPLVLVPAHPLTLNLYPELATQAKSITVGRRPPEYHRRIPFSFLLLPGSPAPNTCYCLLCASIYSYVLTLILSLP